MRTMRTVVGMNEPAPLGTLSDRWTTWLLRELADAPDALSAADVLLGRAIPLFPCVPGGKRPLTPHGFQDASADPAVVGSWWERWPDANIGVPTGAFAGIDVVDVDVHSTNTGFPAFEHARRARLLNGWACLVRTPSGGVHAYFPRDTAGEQRSWQVPCKHIDFRGDGGYIIVPPSRVTGDDGVARPYRLIALAEHHVPRPVDAHRLRTFLDPPHPTRQPTDLPQIGSRPDKLAVWVATRPEGQRNGGLFWAACRMAEGGHDVQAATSLLTEAACSAGLPEREAITTIRSAYRTTTRLGPSTAPSPSSAAEGVRL